MTLVDSLNCSGIIIVCLFILHPLEFFRRRAEADGKYQRQRRGRHEKCNYERCRNVAIHLDWNLADSLRAV